VMAGVDFAWLTIHSTQSHGPHGLQLRRRDGRICRRQNRSLQSHRQRAPVIDQFSEYGTEGGSWYDRWYFGKPWNTSKTRGNRALLPALPMPKRPSCYCRARAIPPIPRPIAGDVPRPSPGGSARRTGYLSARPITASRHRNVRTASSEPWHGLDARRRVVDFIEKAFASAALKPDANALRRTSPASQE